MFEWIKHKKPLDSCTTLKIDTLLRFAEAYSKFIFCKGRTEYNRVGRHNTCYEILTTSSAISLL